MSVTNTFYDQEYLKRIHLDLITTKKRSYELLNPQQDEVIVDAGCGLGLDVQELANSQAKVIGIDNNNDFLRIGNSRNEKNNVEFICSDVKSMPFLDSSVDKIRYERVFQHNEDHNSILMEARRVLKKGGQIQIIDTDFDSISIFPLEHLLQRKIIDEYISRKSLGARQIRGLNYSLKTNGFELSIVEFQNYIFYKHDKINSIIPFDEIIQSAFSQGRISETELQRWRIVDFDSTLSFNMLIHTAFKS